MAQNLKINIGANTSDFQKGAKQVKADLKELNGVTADAVSQLSGLFGVNAGKLQQMGSAIRGLGENLSQSGNAGTAAFGNMLKGLNGLKLGIAGLGIGAVVTAFKALADEANNFKSTVAGAWIQPATQAYIDTYKQVLHDLNAATGAAAANVEGTFKKHFGTWWANVKQGFISGEFAAGAMGMETDGSYNAALAKAETQGARAAAIAKEIYQLERKRSDNARLVAEYEYQIAEGLRIAKDPESTLAEKAEAIARAKAAAVAKAELQYPIEKKISELMDEMNGLAESTPAQIDAANAQYVKTQGILRQQEQDLRAILRLSGSITKEAEAQAAAEAQMAALRANTTDLGLSSGNVLQSYADGGLALTAPTGGLEGTRPENVSKGFEEIVSWSAIATDSVNILSESLGTLFGDVLTGNEDAWSNFGLGLLSNLGDLCVQVGKLAVGVGLAASGIKKALELNPTAAIVAGAALIALGAAVKASMSNIASGSYSASVANVAESGYTTTSNAIGDYERSLMEVRVTGELKASGNQLVAVINNENNRLKHTT